MRLLIQIAFFILIEIAVAIYVYYFSGYQLEHIIAQPPMFLLPPLYGILAALLIGYTLSRLLRKDRSSKSNYALGFKLSFAGYLLLAVSYYVKTEKYNQLFGYNAQNQLLMTSFEQSTKSPSAIAFKELQSKVENPRDLYISSYFSSDTVLQNKQEVSTYYFTYSYQANAEQQFYSIIEVSNSKAKMLVYDERTAESAEYHNAVQRYANRGHTLDNNKDTISVR